MNLIKNSKNKLDVKSFEFKDFKLKEINDLEEVYGQNSSLAGENTNLREIDIEQIKQKAAISGREEGYKDGYDGGYKESVELFEKEMNLIKKISSDLVEYKKEIIKENEQDVVMLAQYIAEKIIRQKIHTESGLVTGIVNFAIKQVSHLGKVIIYLNPIDYEYLRSNKLEIEEIIKNSDEIKFAEDKRIEEGGCIIETENGDIDTQPSSQLKIINRILTDKLNYKQNKN
ncbi:MAG: FliH/SctL family protein [Actinomycetota bacterium]|nr:FliH/SctL family protein [Actinomycetota bacterium]